MDNGIYKITFDGIISENHTIDEVKETLRKRFKLDDNKLNRMFSGKTIILKSGIDRSKALKYIDAFSSSGMICNMEMISPENEYHNDYNAETGNPPESEPEDNDVNEGENQSVMNVKSILGINETPLTTEASPIIRSESYSSQGHNLNSVPDKVPEIKERSDNLSGGINRNSIRNNNNFEEKSEPVKLNNNILHDNARYRIVFSGIVKSGKSTDEVKHAFQNIYGIGPDDVDILFCNKKLVLKDNAKENRALQYIELLDKAGAEVEMVKIDSGSEEGINDPSKSNDLKDAVVANEKAKMELKRIEEKIEETKKYRNTWLSLSGEHKAMINDAMTIHPGRNMKVAKIKAHNLRVRLNNALEKYNNTAEDLTINIRISLAVPKGILMGLISRILPDLVTNSEKDSFYSSLMQKSDLEKINTNDPHIKDMLMTIMKINQIDKKIDEVRAKAYEDFSNEAH